MELRLDTGTKEKMLSRRRRLVEALDLPAAPTELKVLLGQVDAALARFEAGTFGLCESCHDPIEEDRLRADPLIRFCIDHLDRTERSALERDLTMAAQVQRALLPRQDLESAGWEVHYRYEPAGPVSGDYCDVIAGGQPRGALLVVAGDVSGKGVAASLLSAHLSALFRTLDDVGLPVSDMLQRANRLFCESTNDAQYATLVAGRARGDGRVELCNAGQGAPLIVRGGGVEHATTRGLPLGMFCGSPYASETLALAEGDLLVLYTDGVTEARNPRGEEFGVGRLAEALAGARPSSARTAATTCLAALERFRGGAARVDDLTLLILRRAI